MLNVFWHRLIGDPLASAQAAAQRLGMPLAFVIVSANALSSTAYATEEILVALNGGSALNRAYPIAIAVAIVVLLFVVLVAYDHVIRTYPQGGGAYVVAKENLGVGFGVLAAASLLVDYTLTVSVSVIAGVAALTSALPGLRVVHVELAVLLVVVIAVINLRGVRQSAEALALPVYFFVGSLILMVVMGVYRYATLGAVTLPSPEAVADGTKVIGLVFLVRAFSAGCVALTGVEAISNAMGIFRTPEVRNARITLIVMVVLLASLFFSITLLSGVFGVQASPNETVVSQVAKASFGGGNVLYYLVQVMTMLILVVAANTSYSAFPQLAARLARDRFLPRPLFNLGDRLVYSNGIILLTGLSILLIVVFQGNIHSLLPLYAIGVFIGFTLTQAGVASLWWKKRGRGWWRSFGVSAFGAMVTGVVLLVLTVSKFTAGAWMVMLAIPIMLFMFAAIRGHFRLVSEALSLENFEPTNRSMGNVVVIPIGSVHRAVIPALEYAKLTGTKIQAVHVAADEEGAREVQRRWTRLHTDVPLTIIPSPYREVVRPLVRYITSVAEAHPDERITVVVPEFVPKHWWEQLLHNHTAALLKRSVPTGGRILIIDVPYYLPK